MRINLGFNELTRVPTFSYSVGILKTLVLRNNNLDNIEGTVKFLNFRTPENFAVFYLKFKQRGQTLGYFVNKIANGVANSEDPDQTAPLGAV